MNLFNKIESNYKMFEKYVYVFAIMKQFNIVIYLMQTVNF